MGYKMVRVLGFYLALLIAAAAVFAQDAGALVGKWSMTSETDDDPVKWTLILKETDGKLLASLATEEGEAPARDFTYKDGVMRFKAPYQGQDYDIELKAIEQTLTGTWTGGGSSGKTSGTKTP